MQGRVIVVTGGTRGIGRAVSVHVAEQGMTPVLVYRGDEGAAEEALELAKAHASDAITVRCDVSDPTATEALAATVLDKFGRIDGVVHSAFRSGRPAKRTHELDITAWNEDLATNLSGPFYVTRACLPTMVEAGFGRIVFIGSLAMRGERGRVAYTVAKNGLVGLAKTIAQEYAKKGITANVVNPGFIEAGAFLRLDSKIREAAAKMVPMKTLGTGAQVAQAVGYFLSDAAAYTTGQVLGVDGGAR